MATLDDQTRDFLQNHELGVLSTINRDGNIHAAVVYYVVGEAGRLYFMTKSETQKAHNILATHQLALTVYDANTLQTVQLNGTGELEPDQAIKTRVFTQIIRPRSIDDGKHTSLPPSTKLHKGAFIIFRITPTQARFIDFRQ